MYLDWGASVALRWLLVVIFLAAGLLIRRLYLGTTPSVPPPRRRLLVTVRMGVILLLLAAAASPQLIRHSNRTAAPVVAVVVDDSASMARADAPDGRKRWHQAQRVVAVVDSLRTLLVPEARLVTWRGNGGGTLSPLRPEDPPVSQGSDPALLGRQAALRAAHKAPGLVLLVSDGNATVDRIAPPVWPGRSLPVVVGVGDPTGGAGVSITGLNYPEEARLGDRIVVQTTVTLRGSATPQPLVVSLRERDSLLVRRVLKPEAEERVARGELIVRPRHEGLHVYHLTVSDSGRTYADSVEIAVSVRARRQRLLIAAERPDWTTRFLLQAAHAEPGLAAEAAWVTPRGWLRGDSLLSWAPPVDAAGWRTWDGLVLVGWPQEVPVGFGRELRKAVGRGLGLIVVADRSAAVPPWMEALTGLLPVVEIGPVRRGEWALVPPGGAMPSPALQSAFALAGVSPATLPTWLPPLSWLCQAVPGPESTVLLSATGRNGRVEKTSPVIVVTERDGTPVVWIGSGALWQDMFWRPPLWRGEPAGVHRQPLFRLIGALLTYTVTGGHGLAPVTLAGMRRIYRAGERPALLATTHLDTLPSGGEPEVLVQIQPVCDSDEGDTTTTMVRLHPTAGEGGGYRGVLPALPPGRYRLVPRLAGDDTLQGPAREIVVSDRSLEEGAVRQATETLRSLAAAWHGIYLDAGSPSLAAHLAPLLQEHAGRGTTTRLTSVRPLWSSEWFLLCVVGLLTFEWWLRRRAGML